MKITRTSPVTGKKNTLDLDITQDQLDEYADGALAQDAFSNLTPGEREFIISGTLEEEFDMLFGEEDEDDYILDFEESDEEIRDFLEVEGFGGSYRSWLDDDSAF